VTPEIAFELRLMHHRRFISSVDSSHVRSKREAKLSSLQWNERNEAVAPHNKIRSEKRRKSNNLQRSGWGHASMIFGVPPSDLSTPASDVCHHVVPYEAVKEGGRLL